MSDTLPASATFEQILTAAVADMSEHGFDKGERLAGWLDRLRRAAEREVGTEAQADIRIREALTTIYGRMIGHGGVKKYVPGVSRYTLQMIRPSLRAELDRRIMASADLIKLHRREAIDKTMQRFSGWGTSIPPGGDPTIKRVDVKKLTGKSLQEFRYVQHRLAQDQGHKLLASIAHVVAMDSGAIAGEWHSHVGRPGYDARPEHAKRNKKVYAIRDSWAVKQGLINKGAGYTDEMTPPAVEVNCTCWYTFITSPRRVPSEMLTEKGRAFVARGDAALKGMAA